MSLGFEVRMFVSRRSRSLAERKDYDPIDPKP